MLEPRVIYRIKLKGWSPATGPFERLEEARTYNEALGRAKNLVARINAHENVMHTVCTVYRTVLDKSPEWQWPPAETAAPKETPSE